MGPMPSDVSTMSGGQSVEELRRELAEAREQQAATAEILQVISSSPTHLEHVFAAVAASAARLCDANDAAMHQGDGDILRSVAHHGPIPSPSILPLTRGVLTARAVLDRRTIQVADLLAETDEFPSGSDRARSLGFRTILSVPLIRAGEAIGVISLRRREVRAFTDRQIDLLKTFADQAVIAIENTRLFEAEQARTAELKESLEYQTATADVLNVISRSPNDLQPVLNAIIATAGRLCEADYAHCRLERDGRYHVMARHALNPDEVESVPGMPVAADRSSVTSKAVTECRTIHVPDVLADPEDTYAVNVGVPARTILGVPLVRNGKAIGVIVLFRRTVRPFTQRQIELVTTFANQAVIAIENTRLFEEVQARTRELIESLEYQTATSDVLSVISRSPTNIQPVFDTIAQAAAKLCKAQLCHVFRFDGQLIHFAASHGWPQAMIDIMRRRYPIPPGRVSAAARSILTGTIEEIPDIHADPEYQHGDSANYRSIVAVPMLKDSRPVGAICMARTETGAFPKLQLELLRTFADQAVIAIENTRLFEEVQARTKELQDSLDRQ